MPSSKFGPPLDLTSEQRREQVAAILARGLLRASMQRSLTF